MTAPCTKCGRQCELHVRPAANVATYHCVDGHGSFSEYVWPECGGGFTRIEDLSDRRLDAVIKTAYDAGDELTLAALKRERIRRAG